MIRLRIAVSEGDEQSPYLRYLYEYTAVAICFFSWYEMTQSVWQTKGTRIIWI